MTKDDNEDNRGLPKTDHDPRVLEFIRMIEKRPGHCEPVPDKNDEANKEYPVLEPHVPTTCKCGKQYNRDELLALPTKKGDEGPWYYEYSDVELAIRSCTCGARLARRIP